MKLKSNFFYFIKMVNRKIWLECDEMFHRNEDSNRSLLDCDAV